MYGGLNVSAFLSLHISSAGMPDGCMIEVNPQTALASLYAKNEEEYLSTAI